LKKFWTILLCAFVVGCQSAFQRDSAYGDSRAGAKTGGMHKMAFSDSFVPKSERGDVVARFSCDVERPSDKTLAAFADECQTEAYRHMRGEERAGIAATGAKGVRDAFFADYKEWFADEWEAVKSGDLPAHVGEWTCHVEGRVEFCDKKYFSYRVTIDTYCGGAHGNRWIQNATYSRKTGRRLTAVDVVRKESMTDVVNLIRKAVRAEAQDAPLRGQLDEEIRKSYDEYIREIRSRTRDEWGNPLVTDNFMLTKDGIVWTYNQYEIACYAAGWFDALVTWKSLAPHLRDGVR